MMNHGTRGECERALDDGKDATRRNLFTSLVTQEPGEIRPVSNSETGTSQTQQKPLFLSISLSLLQSLFPLPLGGSDPRLNRISGIGGEEAGFILGGKTNLAKVEGLRARPWLKPGACVNGGQYDYDGHDDDHSKPWWRRRLRSLYMAARSFTPSTFRIAVSILLLVAIGTAFTFLPVEQKLKDFLLWIKEDLGPFGPLALALAYIPLTVVAVPASVLTLGGGYLFGLPVGFVADSLGATLGATAAFLLGRTIGKSYVTSKIKHYPKFQAVSVAIQRSGFKIVLLLRVVPILPFNMLNYLLSVTPVRLGEYMLATWLGMMPITFALVYVGTTLKDLSDITHGWHEVSVFRWVLMMFGIALAVILIICITRVAKSSLDKALAENANDLLDGKKNDDTSMAEPPPLDHPRESLIIRIDPSNT